MQENCELINWQKTLYTRDYVVIYSFFAPRDGEQVHPAIRICTLQPTDMSVRVILLLAQTIFIVAYGLKMSGIKNFHLESVTNKTVCPFNVSFETNNSRIPNVIKQINCLPEASKRTNTGKLFGSVYSCIQLIDNKEAYSLLENKTITLKNVKVGCVFHKEEIEKISNFSKPIYWNALLNSNNTQNSNSWKIVEFSIGSWCVHV